MLAFSLESTFCKNAVYPSLRADEIGVAIYKQQQNNIQAQTIESFAWIYRMPRNSLQKSGNDREIDSRGDFVCKADLVLAYHPTA
ncbi:hypothetical protein [Helicobacter sp.]|uniref:hypothetical protein n=1 Tax=Helicobacter sp. TaxID=218 RepID=UPI00388F8BDE